MDAEIYAFIKESMAVDHLVMKSTTEVFAKVADSITAGSRGTLDDSDFAVPGTRRYPIHDEVHAASALARVAQFGSEDEKVAVASAVQERFPNLLDGQ